MLTTCPYFDNLKFDIFVAGGPQCHLSRLYCMLEDFHMSTDTLVENVLLVFRFLPLFQPIKSRVRHFFAKLCNAITRQPIELES